MSNAFTKLSQDKLNAAVAGLLCPRIEAILGDVVGRDQILEVVLGDVLGVKQLGRDVDVVVVELAVQAGDFLALGDLDDHVVHGVSQLVHVLEHGLALLILGDVGNCDLHGVLTGDIRPGVGARLHVGTLGFDGVDHTLGDAVVRSEDRVELLAVGVGSNYTALERLVYGKRILKNTSLEKR